jgi:hypothetical protein
MLNRRQFVQSATLASVASALPAVASSAPPASRAGHAAYQPLDAAMDPYLTEVHLAA